MSGNTFYNGKPIEEIDFREEFIKESTALLQHHQEIMSKFANAEEDKFNYQYWTLKLADANNRLEVPKVTLS